ncbi:hypothetical protein SAMN05216553_112107 [Lentzea fradiae]|uniref:Uncharacterized protein n=1 Tax=Lentzea fradiae TaxID=200378 RepID=A0A1G7XMT2_9PSEU|nr:hypothetical protein [Lentzea fradiae]SDG85376.1 hypothetical protein SAMN05216553_112107 [Lentzea fradiae]
MRTVPVMEYVHSIRYHRRSQNGRLTLAYTEIVTDHGWYIRKEDDWKSRYTTACATEYLTRVAAEAGTFAVSVWRGETRVCTVGLDWNPSKR